MSTLVEMIEALQSEHEPRVAVFDGKGYPVCLCGFGLSDVTFVEHIRKEITPILAAAREQAQELAAMKEQKKPTYCLGLETVRKVAKEGQMETGIVDFVAADSLFHEEIFTDADLREVAEMAIEACDYTAKVVKPWPTPDSIVREFRETSISAELRNFRKEPSKGGMIGGPYVILSRRRKDVRIDEYRYAGKKSKFAEPTLFDDLELGKCNTLQEAR